MGNFITTLQLKSALPSDFTVQNMPEEDVEGQLIRPAELFLEDNFQLRLETSIIPPLTDARPIPRNLRGLFDDYPALETEFKDDCKSCVILLIKRQLTNPEGLQSQSIAGASAVYGSSIPKEVSSIMNRWIKELQVYRGRRTGRVFR